MAEKQARTNARTWRKKAVQIVAVHRSANGATRANMVATTATSATAAVLRAIRKEAPTTTRFYLVGPTEAGATPVREALREAAARFQQDPASGLPGQAKPRANAKQPPEKSATNFIIGAREIGGSEPASGASESEKSAS